MAGDSDNKFSSAGFQGVFQCSSCNTILGDTFAWVCGSERSRTITLSQVTTEVIMGNSLLTSEDELDLGSAYYLLECRKCKQNVGKNYVTTPRHLDELRGFFVLSVDNCNSYEIGSAGGAVKERTNELHKTQVNEIEQSILLLNDRISVLEQALTIAEEEEESEMDNQGNKNPHLEEEDSEMDNQENINPAQAEEPNAHNDAADVSINLNRRRNDHSPLRASASLGCRSHMENDASPSSSPYRTKKRKADTTGGGKRFRRM